MFLSKQKFFRILFLFILLILFSPSFAAAQAMEWEELLRLINGTFRWDPWRHLGMWEGNGRTMVFRPGDPWVVMDGKKLEAAGEIKEENGRLIFSEAAANRILELFGVQDREVPTYRLDTILIDPGHGGRDSGALKKWQVDGLIYPLLEKDVVLEIGLQLAEKLQSTYPQKKILLTRDSDTYPTLEERVAMANNVKLGLQEGMIYISIHVNASLNPKAEGYEVWYLPEDYRRSVVDLGTLGEVEEDIAPIVNTLWEEVFTNESIRLADMIREGFARELGPDVPDRGRRAESWFVVRNTRMASVLVETGFLTNEEEARRLRNPAYLRSLTQGLYNGITEFVEYFENQDKGL